MMRGKQLHGKAAFLNITRTYLGFKKRLKAIIKLQLNGSRFIMNKVGANQIPKLQNLNN